MPSARDTYQSLVLSIVAELEKGVMPWRRPWVVQRPSNLFTRKPYTGINVLALMHAAEQRGFRSASWLTECQARRRGGHVLAAETGRPASIVMLYTRPQAVTSRGGERKVVRVLTGRSFPVYNLEQTRGLGRLEEVAITLDLFHQGAERLAGGWNGAPAVIADPSRAFYSATRDLIAMPDRSQFDSGGAYFATLFHEMIHATGHPSRLARETFLDGKDKFGTEEYAFEELIAELGAAFLCSEAGIGNVGLQNNASYIESWLTVLRRDRNKLSLAAFLAERASDLVLGRVSGGVRNAAGDEQGQAPAAAPAELAAAPAADFAREAWAPAAPLRSKVVPIRGTAAKKAYAGALARGAAGADCWQRSASRSR